jgi:hypothetical protein
LDSTLVLAAAKIPVTTSCSKPTGRFQTTPTHHWQSIWTGAMSLTPIRSARRLRSRAGAYSPRCAPRAYPVAKDDSKLQYFGADDVRFGPGLSVFVGRESADERVLLQSETPADLLHAIFLEPEDVVDAATQLAQSAAGKSFESPANAVGRLAADLRLVVNGLALNARPGRRLVFGASAGLTFSRPTTPASPSHRTPT